jgi:competence protein ComEC
VLLFWRPSALADSSFQLSFAAAGVIAGLALPWIERSSAPYHAALKHLWDVTRDGAYAPKVAQFRIELRAVIRWISSRMPGRMARWTGTLVTLPIRTGLRLWELVLLSTVIQCGMLPLLAGDFHRISLQGPISNIPAVLLTGMIVPLGFLTLAASFVWTRFAFVLARVVSFGVGLLLACVKWFGRVPHTSYRIPGPPLWLTIAFAGALIATAAATRTALRERRGQRSGQRNARQRPTARIAFAEWFSLAILAVFTVLVATYPFAPAVIPGKLEVNILDVGQGDSSFVAFPDGSTLLIDGGGLAGSSTVKGYRAGFDVGENVVSTYLWSCGIQHIDAIAVTHGDHDHMDGLRSVIENFDVGELWIGRDDTRPAVQSLLREARERGVHVAHKLRGDHFNWGAEGDFLNPVSGEAVEKAANDDSLVLRLGDGTRHFLLTGDIQARAEREISSGDAGVGSDFLKVPHHGSKTSSTESFLQAVAPRVAVVSVGAGNPFGHPNEGVMERYRQDGIQVLRTDEYGVVTAQTDGHDLQVFTFTDGMVRWDGASAEELSSIH